MDENLFGGPIHKLGNRKKAKNNTRSPTFKKASDAGLGFGCGWGINNIELVKS